MGDASYYQRNKEKVKASVKAYAQAHKEETALAKRVYAAAHKLETAERYKQWAKNNKDGQSAYHSRWQLSKKYNLTQERHDEMLRQQNGACAICGNVPQKGKRLCIDHDHATGIVRGLLCRNCNAAIGQLGDSIDTLKTAIAYLEQHSTAHLPTQEISVEHQR